MRTTTRKGRLCGSALVLMLLASLSSATAETVEKPASPGLETLADIEKRYSEISSVRMEATFAMTVHGEEGSDATGEPVIGAGTIYYWAQGESYRVRTEADDRLGILGDLDIAFDGDRFQTFRPNSKILTLKAGDVLTIPVLPNPFYLPLDFLSPEADDCPFCKLRLRDLANPETWRKAEVRHAFAQAHTPEAAEAILAEIPAAELGGQPFLRRVRIGIGETAGRVQAIERVTADGKLLAGMMMSSYTTYRGPGVRADLPAVVDLFEYDPESGNLLTETRFIVRTLELNRPIEETVFRIDLELATYVWDEDAQVWLRHPEPEFATGVPR